MPDEKTTRTPADLAREAYDTMHDCNLHGDELLVYLGNLIADDRREVIARLARATGPLTWTAKAGPGVLAEDVLDRDAEILALRAALAARDAELAEVRGERDKSDAVIAEALQQLKSGTPSGFCSFCGAIFASDSAADHINTCEKHPLAAAIARAERAERERDEARYALRAMTTDRDVACRTTSEATTLGIENTQTALREADRARARVAALEAELGRLREAAFPRPWPSEVTAIGVHNDPGDLDELTRFAHNRIGYGMSGRVLALISIVRRVRHSLALAALRGDGGKGETGGGG